MAVDDPAGGWTYAEWAAFDALPRPVRIALWGLFVDWCPVMVRQWLKVYLRANAPDEAQQMTIARLQKADARAVIEDTADWHPPGQSGPSPHMLAAASVQPYGLLCPPHRGVVLETPAGAVGAAPAGLNPVMQSTSHAEQHGGEKVLGVAFFVQGQTFFVRAERDRNS